MLACEPEDTAMSGQVRKILITDKEGGEISAVNTAELHDGKGIVGDRYYGLSEEDNVTLIDQDILDAVNAATGWALTAEDIRRNVVTSGIDLNQWETSQFRIGDAILEGVELCEPCAPLGGILSNEHRSAAELVKALTHKGGLRAKVVKGATINAGDEVTDL